MSRCSPMGTASTLWSTRGSGRSYPSCGNSSTTRATSRSWSRSSCGCPMPRRGSPGFRDPPRTKQARPRDRGGSHDHPGDPAPEPSEYVPYYETYLSKVPKGNLLTLIEDQRRETQQLLSGLSEAKALHRYAPGKWSIKEVVGHLMDTERVFCYRALAFGRADANPLPGFDEKAWVPPGRFDARPLKDLAAELDAVRRATIALFSGLDADALERRGTANSNPITVRALAWIIVGHERHHVGIVRERYLA